MPGFQHYASVHAYPYLRAPFQKYVKITFSVTVKSAVSVHPVK